MSILQRRHGQMLLEVVVAMGILVLFVTAFISLILGAYDGGRKARERTEASYIAWEGLEMVRSIARDRFDDIAEGTFGVFELDGAFVLSGALTIHGQYEREMMLSHPKEDSSTWIAESTVSWGGRSLTLTSAFTDWRRPRWRFDLLNKGDEGLVHATESLGSGGIAFRGQGDLSLPHVFYEEGLFDGVTVRDLEVDANEDRLYVLSQLNAQGPEFAAFDLSNISQQDLPYIDGTELNADGVKFVMGEEYAYVLTAHGDRDIIKIRLSDFGTAATWDILRAAKPIDMAIDETRGKAYVLTNRLEQGKSVSALPPEIATTGFFVEEAYAQGVPTCNGQTATIYVDGSNNIVSTVAKDNGDPYTGTLTGSNSADVIVGTSGNDIINAKNGDDIICGGDGNDTIDGGNNNDTIFGEGGADIITTGNGVNIVCGGSGNDTITGGNSTDSLAGGDGTDTLNGSTGTDICREGEVNTGCEDTTSAIATCGVSASDTTSPTISTLSPADDATDIDVTTNLVITFNENVNVETGNITIYKSDSTQVEQIAVTSGQVTGMGRQQLRLIRHPTLRQQRRTTCKSTQRRSMT